MQGAEESREENGGIASESNTFRGWCKEQKSGSLLCREHTPTLWWQPSFMCVQHLAAILWAIQTPHNKHLHFRVPTLYICSGVEWTTRDKTENLLLDSRFKRRIKRSHSNTVNMRQIDVYKSKPLCLFAPSATFDYMNVCWDFSLSEIPIMCQVSPDSAEAQQQPDSAFAACVKWRPMTDVVFIWTVNGRQEESWELEAV